MRFRALGLESWSVALEDFRFGGFRFRAFRFRVSLDFSVYCMRFTADVLRYILHQDGNSLKLSCPEVKGFRVFREYRGLGGLGV